MIILILILISYVIIGSTVGYVAYERAKRLHKYDPDTEACLAGTFWPITLLIALGVFIGSNLVKKNDEDSRGY
jgi:di/tricarboxylate transporter